MGFVRKVYASWRLLLWRPRRVICFRPRGPVCTRCLRTARDRGELPAWSHLHTNGIVVSFCPECGPALGQPFGQFQERFERMIRWARRKQLAPWN